MKRICSLQKWCLALLTVFIFATLSVAMPGKAQAEYFVEFTNSTQKNIFFQSVVP